MRCLLAGCCGLLLIHLSVSMQLFQRPRFYGVKTNRENVMIYCQSSELNPNVTVKWIKKHADHNETITTNTRYSFYDNKLTKKAIFAIRKVYTEDSGLYFCNINDVWGPGSQIKVFNIPDRANAEYRSKMKDGLIVFQGLLLAVCIAAIILRKQKLLEKQDSNYEEPEIDHIYEGLAIETCEGGLYEELSAYAQADVAEAPWE